MAGVDPPRWDFATPALALGEGVRLFFQDPYITPPVLADKVQEYWRTSDRRGRGRVIAYLTVVSSHCTPEFGFPSV